MRIAMIGPFGFHPKKTMRARAFRLACALAQREHDVQLFMPPWHSPDKANTSWTEEGVGIRYVALGGGHLAITQRLVQEALAFKPHAVHCFKPKAYSGLAAWWLWYVHGRRLRLVVDTDDWEGWGGWNEIETYSVLQKRFFAWQERWGMRHCHALTVASRALETLAWAHGVAPERVHYLPNGPGIAGHVDPRRVAQKRETLQLEGRSVLLLYSRLFEFDTMRLVNLLAQIREQRPDLAVLSVGAGLFEDDATQFRRQLQTAGLLDAVVDVGWVPEPELPVLLATADVGLYLIDDTLLNRTKCPVKLADMLSVGLPVVAEAVGQVPAYVQHHQTGLLYESGDVEGLANGVLKLFGETALSSRLGAAAQHHIQRHFSWDHLAQCLVSVYA